MGLLTLEHLRDLKIGIVYPVAHSSRSTEANYIWAIVPAIARHTPRTTSTVSVTVDITAVTSCKQSKAYVAAIRWEELASALKTSTQNYLRIDIVTNPDVEPQTSVDADDCVLVRSRLVAEGMQGKACGEIRISLQELTVWAQARLRCSGIRGSIKV